MIPQKTVQLIEETAKIEEVVGDFLTLKRRGASYVACCPFHNEKTPSFYVTPSKGIFKCFGCGKAGTAIGFVMEYEHCSYSEALKYLGKKYHIEVEEVELTPEEIMGRQRRESLMIVAEFAHKFFCDQLKSGEGKDATKPVCMLCNGSTFFKLYKVQSRVKAYLEDVLVNQRGIYYDIIERENDITLGTAIGGLITR